MYIYIYILTTAELRADLAEFIGEPHNGEIGSTLGGTNAPLPEAPRFRLRESGNGKDPGKEFDPPEMEMDPGKELESFDSTLDMGCTSVCNTSSLSL
jgi:hypothetical protein